MATRKGKLPTLSKQSEKSFEVLKELNARLVMELNSEQKALKEMRREKAQTIKHIQEQEQHRYSIALKDMKVKLHGDKLREMELQKEALLRKNDVDLQKVAKQHELESVKLQTDLRKCQDELRDVTKRGLSGTARGTFEAERLKMLREVQDLRKTKQTLEDSVQELQESDKQKSFELRRLEDEKNTLMAKQKKEYDVEIRKLLDEIRKKARTITQLQQELGSISENIAKLQQEKKTTQDALNISKEVVLRIERKTAAKNRTGVQLQDSNDETSNIVDSNRQTGLDSCSLQQQKVTELLNKLNEQCTSLSHEKKELQRRVQDVSKKHRVLLERNRLIHDKNMQLSSCNRRLEERVKTLAEDNACLAGQLEEIQQNQDRLEEQLSCHQTDRAAYDQMLEEVVSLKLDADKQGKKVTALEKTCAEKDRRIELMAHRQRKQNLCGTGHSDKFTMEEYEKNYQRFVKEHLELERQFALLQASNTIVLEKNGSKNNVALTWQEEKDKLNKRVKMLREKLGEKAEAYTQLQLQQQELQEHTDILEFRLLELQDTDEEKQPTNDQYSQTECELGAKICLLESEVTTLRETISHYEKSDGFLADKNVSLMEGLDALRAENQALVDDYESLKYTILKLTRRLRSEIGVGGFSEKEQDGKEEKTAGKEVEEELEGLCMQVRDNEGAHKELVRRLQQMLEERDAEVARYREETERQSQQISASRQQVQQLDQSSSTEKESPRTPSSLTDQDQLQVQSEIQDLTELKYQVKELQEVRKTLDERVQQLQFAAGEEHKKAEDLSEKVKILEATNKTLDQQLSLTNHQSNGVKDLENSRKQLDGQESILQNRIKDLETQLTAAKEEKEKACHETEELNDEKLRRVENLQEQLERMRENEIRLSETIVELEEVEHDLKQQLEAKSDSKPAEDSFATPDGHVAKLKASEQNLKDQVEQMEQNQKLLKDRLAEMEEDQKKQQEKKSQKIKELEETVKELSEKEASLLEEVYQMKLENQELQEHVDQLLADAEDESDKSSSSQPTGASRNHNSEVIEQLKDNVAKLETENSNLKDQLLRSKLDALDTIPECEEDGGSVAELAERIQQLEQQLRDSEKETAELREKMTMLERGEREHENEIQEKDAKEKQLLKKVEVLEQSEDKLMQQVDSLYESEAAYKEKLEKLSHSQSQTESSEDSSPLKEKVAELEAEKAKLESELSKKKMTSESKEVAQLKQKVDILLDTEEKLLDRLQQQELVERQLHKDLEQSEEEVEQLEKENEELETKLASAEEKRGSLEKVLEEKGQVSIEETQPQDWEEDKKMLQSQIKQLEDFKERLETEVAGANKEVESLKAALEKQEKNTTKNDSVATKVIELESAVQRLTTSETHLQEKVAAAETQKADSESSEIALCKQIAVFQEKESAQELQIAKLDQTEQALREKVSDLEKHNKALLDVVSTLKSNSAQHGDRAPLTKEETKNTHGAPVATKTEMQNGCSLRNIITDTSLLMETLPSYTPLEPSELEGMSRQEMTSKIQELEQMEKFHRSKIGELSTNLATLRGAVEVVAITMETDADIPVINIRPTGKDWNYEMRVQELVKTEVQLKLKVLELQKKEAILRSQLQDAELALKDQEADFKEELEVLEDEIHKLRKSESRLKNQRKYGSQAGSESAALSQIQHLNALVHDLEKAESKLKRHNQDLQKTNTDLRSKLDQGGGIALVDHLGNLKSVKDKDRYYDLLQQLKEMEYSENDLKSQLTHAERDGKIRDELEDRIAELERKERGLKSKLDLLENNESGFLEEEVLHLDSPEAILQQRIKELEKMEKHLKVQVVELEKDREELHEIARRDKVHIHEMSVQLRQLQVSEQNLKQQLHRTETQEGQLSLKVDDLVDHVEQLEDMVKLLEANERCLKVRLHKQQYNEEDLNFKLENTKDDLVNTETKLKKKITETEQERRDLRRKNEELVNTVADLEAGKFSLEQKIRQTEKQNTERSDHLADLQKKQQKAQKRETELEALNENLVDKIRKLEEEKAGFVFEMASHEHNSQEHIQLKKKVTVLKNQLSEEEVKKSNLQKKLDELTAREVETHERKQKQEKTEWELREKIAELKITVEQLQHSITDSHNKAGKTGSFKDKPRFSVLSQGVQVELMDTFTTKHTSPEFKTALKNLGLKHPVAYQHFVRDLQSGDLVVSDGNQPAFSSRLFIQLNELNEAREELITPVVKPGRAPAQPRPIDVATGPQRQQLIDDLAHALPKGSVPLLTDASREDPHWRTVEERKSEDEDDLATTGKQHWKTLEKNKVAMDDMALTVNVYDSDDESANDIAEASPIKRPPSACSIDSRASSVPPPLPRTAPPSKPLKANNDSADEISDIEEDTSLPPLRKSYAYNNQLRAKSADRDSDFSEGTWTASSAGRHHRPLHGRSATSLDSITDSGMFQEEDVKILKERILYLETQLQKKDSSPVQQTWVENRAGALTAEVEAERKQEELRKELTALKGTNSELTTKVEQLQAASRDKHDLERIILKLRGQLKEFERTDLQKQELERKLHAVEEELKTKAQTESKLVRENAKMKHHIDSLKRKRQEDLEENFDYVESIGFNSPDSVTWSSPGRLHSKIPRRQPSQTVELVIHSPGRSGSTTPTPADRDLADNSAGDFVLSPPQLSYVPVTELDVNTNNNNTKWKEPSRLPVYQNDDQHLPLQQQQQQQQHSQQQRWILSTSPRENPPEDQSWKIVGSEPRLRQPTWFMASDSRGLRVEIPSQQTLDIHAGPPSPPSNLHVERIVGHRSILLAWCIPELDELSRSNGAVVKGYKIYINSHDKQLVASAYMTKALIERLNLHQPHTFSIQTLAENGQVSRVVNTAFDDILPERHSAASDSASDVPDQSSIVGSSLCSDGEQRVFMAVYDYDASTTPPTAAQPRLSNLSPLPFKTGDVVVTYGDLRPDGYFFAKVHGRKGLVPANFIEEVALLRSLDQTSVSTGSLASYTHPSSGASSEKSRSQSRASRARYPKMSSAQV